MKTYRIGQIVPSSNTTMETEIPAMLRAREAIRPERFTFHSSRMRMKKVTQAELAAMDAESHRCAAELADARVDVMGYACLVAIMSMGHGYHRESEKNLQGIAEREAARTEVVTSAGALLNGLNAIGAKRVSVVMPYTRPLADLVLSYLQNEGIEVADHIALGIGDNLEVGRRDPMLLVKDVAGLNKKDIDAVVLSACVQMPSLPAVPVVEKEIGLPVVTASVCTTWEMLKRLGAETIVPNAGALLSGRYA